MWRRALRPRGRIDRIGDRLCQELPMEISRQADYAVRAVLHLALHRSDLRVPSAEIAETQNVPAAFLTKILARLANAGIVDLKRGVHGGVSLAKPAGEFSLLEVVEAVDGPVTLNRCMARPGECPRDAHCLVHPLWLEIREEFRARLAGISFSDLAGRAAERA